MFFFKNTKLPFFMLFCLIATLFIAFSQSQPVKAFVQNEDAYWNKGELSRPSNGQGNINHCTLQSTNLNAPNNTVGLNVYTPPSYDSSSQDYPVIYLLHGLNGSEYNYFSYFNDSTFFSSSSGSLPSYIDNGLTDEAIIVFVNGGAQSFYNDWSASTEYGPNSDFPILSETIIMDEVIPFVDSNFRTIANRNGRAVEGFSMGGRGAVKLAFNHPDQFCSTIAYAGAAYESIPGSAVGNPYIGPHEPANQISNIVANNAANILATGLQIRLVDGVNDGAAGQGGGSDALSSQLNSLGISHQFVASQSGVNGHSWSQYHSAVGAESLNFHFQCFNTGTVVSTSTLSMSTSADQLAGQAPAPTRQPRPTRPSATPPPAPSPTPLPYPSPSPTPLPLPTNTPTPPPPPVTGSCN